MTKEKFPFVEPIAKPEFEARVWSHDRLRFSGGRLWSKWDMDRATAVELRDWLNRVLAPEPAQQLTTLSSPRSALWRHMHDAHGLTLLESELDEIELLAKACSAGEPPASLRSLIADDAYAATFQSMAQYRAALLASAPPPAVNELGNVRDPDAAVSQLLQSYFWLKTLKPNTRYARLQDDHDGKHEGWLSVTIGEDGDAWVSLDDDARFRMPGHGGGASQYTRTALVILAEAIRRDNAEHPRRSAPTKESAP